MNGIQRFRSTPRFKIPDQPDQPDHKYDQRILAKNVESSAGSLSDLVSKVEKVLAAGLGDRVTGIWCSLEHSDLSIGLLLNKENCFRLVDYGPLADQPVQAEEFRQLWGSLSEMRRFKDGAIREAVAWEPYAAKRGQICPEIVRHLLKLHFGISETATVNSHLDLLVPSGSFAPVMAALETLSKNLCNLPNAPLAIVQCDPISPSCRYTDFTPPQPITKSSGLAAFTPVHEVVLRLESSGKWPDDVHAVAFAKQAFSLHFARRLGDEFGLETSVASSFFDVCQNGFVFRCYVLYDRELVLLRANGLATDEHELRMIKKPALSRALHSLHTSHIVFGPIARLAKRWIASQMLSLQFSSELVELLVASLFTAPSRYLPPCSVGCGFLRFLYLLSAFDWGSCPLVVDFDGSLAGKVPPQTNSFPEHCLVVFTSTEGWDTPSAFSLPSRYKSCLSELRLLAKTANDLIVASIHGSFSENIKVVFQRSTDAFDSTLALNPAVILRSAKRPLKVSPLFVKSLRRFISSKDASFPKSMPGFDPIASAIANLEKFYGKVAEFFYDIYGGKCIAIRWIDGSVDREKVLAQIRRSEQGIVQSVAIFNK